MAEANTCSVGYIAESTWATTPGSAALQTLRILNDSLRHEKNTAESAELDPTRMTSDLAQVGASASGDIAFELSYGTFDEFLESALYSTWTAIAPGAIGSLAIASDVISGSASDFDDILVGGWIKIAGATISGNNGLKRVVAKANDGSTITLATGQVANDAGPESLTITSSDLRNGTAEKSFSIERTIPHSGTDYFQSFLGMVVAQLSLDISTQQIATGSMSLIGSVGASSLTSIDAAGGYTAANTNSVMNGTSNVGTLYLDDYLALLPTSTAMTEKIKQLTLAVNNNVRGLDALGSLGNFDLGAGTMDLTGTMELYFASNDFFADFIAHTYKSFAFTIADTAGNTYVFTVPRIQFADANPALSGKNTDVMQSVQWRGIKDSLSEAQLIINRFPA